MLRVFEQVICRRILFMASLAAFALSLAASEQATAVPPSPVGYNLQISPYARVLDAVGETWFNDVLMEESCDNPHLRIRARNKPALMITNDDTSDAPITSFSMTINSGPYLFGNGDFATDNFNGFIKDTIYNDPGVTITGSSITNGGKTLNVNFSGLDAGRKVIFNIDLDAEDMGMFPFPDYRNVLFGAPTVVNGEPSDPASYLATFTDFGSPAPNTATLGGTFEQMQDAPTFMNDHVRPYNAMDGLEITVVTPQVPEPATIALAVVGIATLAARRRARRAA